MKCALSTYEKNSLRFFHLCGKYVQNDTCKYTNTKQYVIIDNDNKRKKMSTSLKFHDDIQFKYKYPTYILTYLLTCIPCVLTTINLGPLQ